MYFKKVKNFKSNLVYILKEAFIGKKMIADFKSPSQGFSFKLVFIQPATSLWKAWVLTMACKELIVRKSLWSMSQQEFDEASLPGSGGFTLIWKSAGADYLLVMHYVKHLYTKYAIHEMIERPYAGKSFWRAVNPSDIAYTIFTLKKPQLLRASVEV